MDPWKVTETSFSLERQLYQETVFTIGNGYLGTRGTFEEGYKITQPVTLVHGVFDDVPIVHTELVNVPSWTDLTILVGDDRFRLDRGEILSYTRELDLRTGILSREVQWRSPAGATLTFAFERFASLARPHVLGVRCRITSEDYTGPVELRAGLSGIVDNAGYRHLVLRDQGRSGERSVHLSVETAVTGIVVSEAAALGVLAETDVAYTVEDCPWSPTIVGRCQLMAGSTLQADKVVTLFTSRDVEDPQSAATTVLNQAVAEGYASLRSQHEAAWEALWDRADVVIEGDEEAQLAVRYSLFQLMIAAPRLEEGASIPAKTLSGFGYRGHAFWDTEIFMLPFFIFTQPEVARNMLMYRYHTLPGARRKAASQGFEGAMYAWESAATGDETTPRWVPVWVKDKGEDELIRIWCGDIELHITADVAYAVHQYWRVTGDDTFMRDYGAEIILDTARFWGSRAEWNSTRGIYEICDVIGPDENHDHINNNAFTNGMARWNLEVALKVLAWLRAHYPDRASELEAKLGLSADTLARWRTVSDGLYIGFDPETRLVEQFDGFYGLQEVIFEEYEPRETSFQALLGIEETQRCQVLKQPDVLMLLYLLDEGLREAALTGDVSGQATLQANWAFYTPRTDLTYGSSLGPAIQAALAARMGDLEQAYRFFQLAAYTDLQNSRGNTPDGIHGATAGGLWQAVVFGFGGVRLTDEGPVADLRLPEGWTRLAFRLCYRGEGYDFDLRPPESCF
ncbi:MAG: glycoside hydrolase family 65 protein [Anaerolineae bacterium]